MREYFAIGLGRQLAALGLLTADPASGLTDEPDHRVARYSMGCGRCTLIGVPKTIQLGRSGLGIGSNSSLTSLDLHTVVAPTGKADFRSRA